MTQVELSKAKNPDLRVSLAALQRAAKLARQIALQTNTALVVVRHGKLLHIPAVELRTPVEPLVEVLAAMPNVGTDADFTR